MKRTKMAKLKTVLFYYDLIFVFVLLIISLLTKSIISAPQFLVVFVPLVMYFWGYLIINSSKKMRTAVKRNHFWVGVAVLLVFNFVATLLLSSANLYFSRSLFQLLISLLYIPFPLYFFLVMFHWYAKLKPVKTEVVKETSRAIAIGPTKLDQDRRRFLKMVGGTSLSVVVLSLLNPKQAGAAFFGSVPGPGTVAIKDAAGTKINPAEKHPTDGYKISKLDDSSSDTYAYYGFMNKDSAWYIQRETISGDDEGDFMYVRGDSNFLVSWAIRSGLSYQDFDSVF